MITDKKSEAKNSSERAKEIRKLKKQGWISSVKISLLHWKLRQKINVCRKLIKLCKNSEEFHSVRFDFNGTKKHYFKASELKEMIATISQDIKNNNSPEIKLGNSVTEDKTPKSTPDNETKLGSANSTTNEDIGCIEIVIKEGSRQIRCGEEYFGRKEYCFECQRKKFGGWGQRNEN